MGCKLGKIIYDIMEQHGVWATAGYAHDVADLIESIAQFIQNQNPGQRDYLLAAVAEMRSKGLDIDFHLKMLAEEKGFEYGPQIQQFKQQFKAWFP